MTTKKDTVLLLYPPGAYGTFIEWCVCYFSGQLENDDLPFNTNGNAHKYLGTKLDNPSRERFGIKHYVESDSNVYIARCHASGVGIPITNQFVDQFTPYFRKIIVVRPDPTVSLLILHNVLTKLTYPESFQNWLLGTYTEGPLWHKRESISYQLSAWYDYLMLWNQFRTSHADAVYIDVCDFVQEPSSTIDFLLAQLGLPKIKDRPEVFVHWQQNQKFLRTDQTCRNIVQAVVDQQDLDWSHEQLDIYDEAWIQWALRVLHQLDIRCYNLDVFPTNTKELRNYLIDV